jgi:hypothetical protein
MLGIYDNDAFNDQLDSTGAVTTDVEALGSSWEVGHRFCRSRNLATPLVTYDMPTAFEACRKHLNHSSSYYAPCFERVGNA